MIGTVKHLVVETHHQTLPVVHVVTACVTGQPVAVLVKVVDEQALLPLTKSVGQHVTVGYSRTGGNKLTMSVVLVVSLEMWIVRVMVGSHVLDFFVYGRCDVSVIPATADKQNSQRRTERNVKASLCRA